MVDGPVAGGGDPRPETSPEDASQAAPGADELDRAVERQRDIARRSAQEAERLADELHQTRLRLADSEAELDAIRRRLDALLRSAPVRMGRLLSRRLRWVRRGSEPATPDRRGQQQRDRSRVTERDERALRARLTSSRDGAPATGPSPLVSVVIVAGSRTAPLRRSLPAIRASEYPALEIIVVHDGSANLALSTDAGPGRVPVRELVSSAGGSYAELAAQGAALAGGEWLAFLDPGSEPVSPHWLGYLAQTLRSDDVAAVGARSIHPRRTGADGPVGGPQLTLAHGGVAFAMANGGPVPVLLGSGEDPTSEWAAATRDEPAVDAGCLMLARATFDAIGGFAPGLAPSPATIDLCLRMAASGKRVVYDGRAALWAHRPTGLGDRRAIAALVDRWAPRLYRTILLDALDGRCFWRRRQLEIAIMDGDGLDAIERDLRVRGYVVRRAVAGDPPDAFSNVDAVVVGDPSFDALTLPVGPVRIAWIDDPSAWSGVLADYDIEVRPSGPTPPGSSTDPASGSASGEGPGEAITTALRGWLLTRRIGIRIPVRTWETARGWGDTYYARDLRRAIARLGWPTRVYLRPSWSSGAAAREDVMLDLMGKVRAQTRPAQLSVLWHISHPDRVDPTLYRRYDLVFVASDQFAAWMSSRVEVPVRPLHQATDPERFHPDPSGPAHELLFVAGWRPSGRQVLSDLLPTPHRLAVYGPGWIPDRLDPAHLAGAMVPNDQLGRYYSSAAIVLNDHWLDMRREGFFSNRLYDAAAAGAFVITDDVEGLEEEFDGGIVAYRDRVHLAQLVDHYLANPEERRVLADRARRAVLARHTFAHRAREIVDAIEPLVADRPLTLVDGGGGSERAAEGKGSGEPRR